MRSKKTIQMAEVALMSAVLCVISPFTIPIPFSPVPMSLALFGLYLTAMLLGAKKGVVSVLIYLLLGTVGLPVFSGLSGGVGILLGPTGGYLIGYVPCALVIGWMRRDVAKKGSLSNRWQMVWNGGAMAIGTVVCYTFGTVWFVIVMKGTYTLPQALVVCVVPYLIFDVVKILAAAVIGVPVQKIVRKIEL